MTRAKRQKMKVLVDEWTGCYGESWQGVISPAAISHPAKFSRALIRRIYDHVIAENWASVEQVLVVTRSDLKALDESTEWCECTDGD